MDDKHTTLELPDARAAQETVERALFEIRPVIAGQDRMLERVLVCLLAGAVLLLVASSLSALWFGRLP